MSVPVRLLAFLLVGLLTLSACDPDDEPDGGEEVAEETEGIALEDAVLVVYNDTETDLCDLHISDFDEPDNEGYDLIETPLAPGDSLSFPYGSHEDTDDHNLIATATSCEGTEYGDYHFSYHLGGGRYVVDEWHLKE